MGLDVELRIKWQLLLFGMAVMLSMTVIPAAIKTVEIYWIKETRLSNVRPTGQVAAGVNTFNVTAYRRQWSAPNCRAVNLVVASESAVVEPGPRLNRPLTDVAVRKSRDQPGSRHVRSARTWQLQGDKLADQFRCTKYDELGTYLQKGGK